MGTDKSHPALFEFIYCLFSRFELIMLRLSRAYLNFTPDMPDSRFVQLRNAGTQSVRISTHHSRHANPQLSFCSLTLHRPPYPPCVSQLYCMLCCLLWMVVVSFCLSLRRKKRLITRPVLFRFGNQPHLSWITPLISPSVTLSALSHGASSWVSYIDPVHQENPECLRVSYRSSSSLRGINCSCLKFHQDRYYFQGCLRDT